MIIIFGSESRRQGIFLDDFWSVGHQMSWGICFPGQNPQIRPRFSFKKDDNNNDDNHLRLKKSPPRHIFGRFFAGPQISSGSRFRSQKPQNRIFSFCFENFVSFFEKSPKNTAQWLPCPPVWVPSRWLFKFLNKWATAMSRIWRIRPVCKVESCGPPS